MKRLEAIVAAPDDPAPKLVYADALVAEGDPHGELILVQHRGLADAELRQQLGLAQPGLVWKDGFVVSAELDLPDMWALSQPAFVTVRTLTVRGPLDAEAREIEPLFEAPLPCLRALTVDAGAEIVTMLVERLPATLPPLELAVDVRSLRGKTARRLAARREALSTIELVPIDQAQRAELAKVLLEDLRRPAEALELIELHLAARPDDRYARLTRVQALAEVGRIDEALAELDTEPIGGLFGDRIRSLRESIAALRRR